MRHPNVTEGEDGEGGGSNPDEDAEEELEELKTVPGTGGGAAAASFTIAGPCKKKARCFHCPLQQWRVHEGVIEWSPHLLG
jgi:hypothetical protein